MLLLNILLCVNDVYNAIMRFNDVHSYIFHPPKKKQLKKKSLLLATLEAKLFFMKI